MRLIPFDQMFQIPVYQLTDGITCETFQNTNVSDRTYCPGAILFC